MIKVIQIAFLIGINTMSFHTLATTESELLVGEWCEVATSLQLNGKRSKSAEDWRFAASGMLTYSGATKDFPYRVENSQITIDNPLMGNYRIHATKDFPYRVENSQITIDNPLMGNYRIHAISETKLILVGTGYFHLQRGKCTRITDSHIAQLQRLVIRGKKDELQEQLHFNEAPDYLIDGISNSNTLINLAAKYGRQGIVELLLNLGADPNIKNEFGENALDLAKKNKHNNVIELLTRVEKKED